MPEVKRDEAYEEMAAAFQCALIQVLDEVLRENELELPERRTICEAFARRSGVLLDQNWVETEAGRVFPVIGFTHIHQDYDPVEVIVSDGGFSFAEYAGGDIRWFFDEHDPNSAPQRVGVVGDDGRPSD